MTYKSNNFKFGRNPYASHDEWEAAEEAARLEALNEEVQPSVSWKAASGQEIEIKTGIGVNNQGQMCDAFVIYINGIQGKTVIEVVDLAVSPAPGIVAKVGNIGLTAERRDAVLALMNSK